MRLAVVIAALCLSGCGPAAQRYWDCAHSREVGREPLQVNALFGLAGADLPSSNEHDAWHDRLVMCVNRDVASR
jgi:hypothetical protein